MKKIIILLSIIPVFIILSAASCVKKEEVPVTNQTPTPSSLESEMIVTDDPDLNVSEGTEETTDDVSSPVDSEIVIKEFQIESFVSTVDGNFAPRFTPNMLEVNEGDVVRIVVNVTSGRHDFKLDEFGIYVDTPTNEKTVIEFVADKAGSFEYYCNQPGHRAAGQWGTLVVNPKLGK